MKKMNKEYGIFASWTWRAGCLVLWGPQIPIFMFKKKVTSSVFISKKNQISVQKCTHVRSRKAKKCRYYEPSFSWNPARTVISIQTNHAGMAPITQILSQNNQVTLCHDLTNIKHFIWKTSHPLVPSAAKNLPWFLHLRFVSYPKFSLHSVTCAREKENSFSWS